MIRQIACIFFITLAACGGGGGSSDSTPTPTPTPTASPMPGNDTLPPSSPGNLTVSPNSTSALSLDWDTATDNTGVTGYRIYRDGQLISSTLNSATIDDNLTTGVNYCYEVSAYDTAGNESALSQSVCAMPSKTWAERVPGVDIVVTSIAYNGSRYVAAGDQFTDNYVLISEDAENWTAVSVNVPEIADILWADTQFIAVSKRGDLYRSPNGESWTQTQSAAAFIDLYAAAWSGSMAAAIGEAGNIWSSPDGVTWTERTGVTSENLRDIAWIVDTFVAVGDNGTILTSTDGSNWTQQPTAITETLYAVTGNASTFVTVGVGGGYLSTDATTWSPYSIAGLLPTDITWAEGLNSFVIVDTNGVITTSPDGTSWTQRLNIDQIFNLETILWAGNRLVSGGSFAEITVSSDAIAWETSNSSFDITRVRWSNGLLYATGGPSKLATSPDGINWSYHRTGYRSDYHNDIATNGSLIVAAGQTYYMSTTALTQTPWSTHQFFGATTVDNAVIWDGNQFVSVGTSGTLRVSTDGVSHNAFTNAVTGTSDVLTGVVWDGGQYTVSGYNGTIITSPDLVNWTSRASTTTANLRDLAYSNGRTVSVGDNGTVVYSSDGVSWSAGDSGTTQILHGITWADTEFIAVGNGATVIRSEDGDTWETFAEPPPLKNFRGVAFTGSQIVIGGNDGSIATIEK